jgi:hypothetical protein
MAVGRSLLPFTAIDTHISRNRLRTAQSIQCIPLTLSGIPARIAPRESEAGCVAATLLDSLSGQSIHVREKHST